MNHNQIITESINNKQTVFYLFHSDTCANCSLARPILQEQASKHMIPLHKIEDADNNGSLFDLFEVDVYPTLIYIKEGRVLKYVGLESIVGMLKNISK